jgi:hypothetical protein
MTILILDKMPDKAAMAYRDKDLCGAIDSVYNILMDNTPSILEERFADWTRESIANYSWMMVHAHTLCERYQSMTGGQHMYSSAIMFLYDSPSPVVDGFRFTDVPINLVDKYCTITVPSDPPTNEVEAAFWREEELFRYDPAPLGEAVACYTAWYADQAMVIV